jgi:glutamate synthase (NADPH/NADH) small chain
MSMTAKERMAITRQHMPEREPMERNRDFREVNLGFSVALAQLEANRCLQCKDRKCVSGCPVGIDIPGFLEKVSAGDLRGAAELLLSANALPGITGRVCPQEEQCEQLCIRGKKGEPVAVGHLERFVADWARENLDMKQLIGPPTGFRVAVVGSGPAGLTCAGELARKGHNVTVFEALHQPGGVLTYGIPEFRLPNKIIDAEVDRLRQMGVKIICNVVIGRTFTVDELLNEEGFDAMFIANGAGLPIFMNIPGENLKGVYSANEYLTRSNLMRAYDFPDFDTPIIRARARGRHRRRQRRDGRRAHRQAPGRQGGHPRLSPQPQRNAGARRRGQARGRGRHHLQVLDQPGSLPRYGGRLDPRR